MRYRLRQLALLLLAGCSIMLLISVARYDVEGKSDTGKSVKLTSKTIDGVRLAGLFADLHSNELFSLRHILSIREQHEECLKRQAKGISLFDRLLRVTPVYAQYCSSQAFCTGSYWYGLTYSCSYSGSSCTGQARDTEYDPLLAGPCDGFIRGQCGVECAYCPYPNCSSCG